MAKDKLAKDANGKALTAFDRAIQTAIGDGRTVGADDDPATETFPRLWEWMSNCYVGLDRVHTPPVVTVTLGPSGVLVQLNDRDLCVNLSAACKHLHEVWKALEDALNSPVPPVRSYGKKEPRLRKKPDSK